MRENTRAIFLLTLATLFTVAYFWIAPAEKAVEATNAQADAVLQEAEADERALADEPRVRLLAQRIRGDLKGLRIRPASGDMSQALLGDLQTAAARNRLTVVGVKPATAEAADTQRQESEISVRGSYRDTLSFLRDLSHMPTLARVLAVQLDRTNDGAPTNNAPSIDAVIRVQTIRLDRTILP
jgi:Tfp pilus assembly protein PilO